MTAKERMVPILAAHDADIVTASDETVPATAPLAPDESDVVDHTLVKVRSAALLVIAVLISLAALRYASDIFVPLVMGLMLSYALTPLVNRMVRVHVPRTLSAAILLLSIIGGIGMLAYTLSDDAVDLIEGVPEIAQKVRSAIYDKHIPGQPGTMEKVQKAASEIERASDEGNRALEHGSDVTRVQIENPKVNVMDYLLPGTVGLATGVANAAVMLFVAFFLLAQGDNFRRKMVRLAGPRLSHKKLTLRALEEINEQIQRYLLVQVFTSTLVGLATWLTFLWIGLEHAAVWGVAAFIFNFIPYLGSVFIGAAAMLMGFVQFGTFDMALLIGGVVLLINSVESYVLTPWLTSRSSRMNPVAVFAGVLAWGWLWGIWGLFLGVPILVMIKVVCDRVEDFRAVGELLGE